MKELRTLFQQCSQIKGFNHWLLGTLYFDIIELPYRKQEILSTIIKQRKDYAILELSWKESRIKVHLFRQVDCTKKRTAMFLLPEGYIWIASKVFSKQEIYEFAEAVQDYNSIHQMELPIVPGFLMVEWLWYKKGIIFLDKIMAFHEIIYAQEEMKLYFDPYTQSYVAIKNETELDGLGKKGIFLWELRSKNR